MLALKLELYVVYSPEHLLLYESSFGSMEHACPNGLISNRAILLWCMCVFVCMSENECKRQSELKTNLYFQLNPFLKTENKFFFCGVFFDSSWVNMKTTST